MRRLEKIVTDIRRLSIEAIYHARSGHPGGSLSIAEILAVLYFDEMQLDPGNPDWEHRDRFILSKGHGCPALYAALALKGYFPVEEVNGLRKVDHFLEGHPDVRTPGVDCPSGSLGMGLSQGVGMALGAVLTGSKYRTYVLMGDGDMQEGNTWEAFMSASHMRLGGLTAILDYNGLQGDASVTEQMDYNPVKEKIEAFGWHFQEVDGHDMQALKDALEKARSIEEQPSFILAKTVKGKGVEFMENQLSWHGSSTLTDDEYRRALAALEV